MDWACSFLTIAYSVLFTLFFLLDWICMCTRLFLEFLPRQALLILFRLDICTIDGISCGWLPKWNDKWFFLSLWMGSSWHITIRYDYHARIWFSILLLGQDINIYSQLPRDYEKNVPKNMTFECWNESKSCFDVTWTRW